MTSADKKIITRKKRGQSVIFKSLFGLFLLLLTYSSIISMIGYRSFTTAMLDQYAEGAFLTANSAADELEPWRMDGFVKDAEQFDDLTMLCMEYLGPDPLAGEA